MPAGLTVLHTSDFQCGEPYLPHAGEALVRIAHDIAPDVVVVSGDLTQRAKRREHIDNAGCRRPAALPVSRSMQQRARATAAVHRAAQPAR